MAPAGKLNGSQGLFPNIPRKSRVLGCVHAGSPLMAAKLMNSDLVEIEALTEGLTELVDRIAGDWDAQQLITNRSVDQSTEMLRRAKQLFATADPLF
jgi:hypothetical protein